jgi:hypothetical protein
MCIRKASAQEDKGLRNGLTAMIDDSLLRLHPGIVSEMGFRLFNT